MNSSTQRPGLLFTLVAPAGAGKSRLIKYVLGRTPLRQLPTATTRPIRPDEQQRREHDFVSPAQFQRMIDADQLLEHQVIHGNLYGMPRAAVERALISGQSVIADIEVLGTERARAIYPDNVVAIFIQPPSIGTLIERMRERDEVEAEIGKRLLRVPMELKYARHCDYVLVNDQFERAADLLYRIVMSELQGARRTVEGDALIDYHYRFEAQVVPVLGDETLHAPFPLTTALTDSELPHQAALRCLRQALDLDARESALVGADKPDGDYVAPTTLDYRLDERGECLTYRYFYRLDERIALPAGWSWMPQSVLESQRDPAS